MCLLYVAAPQVGRWSSFYVFHGGVGMHGLLYASESFTELWVEGHYKFALQCLLAASLEVFHHFLLSNIAAGIAIGMSF